jgi:NHL repeat
VHNICADVDCWVYVTDRENHRVRVFDGFTAFPVLPAKEAVTQLASTNMVALRLLLFLAIPAQAGTHASAST